MRLLSAPRFFYGWWIVVAGFAIQWTVGALMLHPFGIYVVEFEEEFGWNRTKLSVAFSLARVEDGLLGPFQGWMIDRFGPRAVIRVGVVLFALGFVAFSMMNSLLMFYLTFLLMAIGAALAGFLSVTTAVVNWFSRRRTLAVSLALIGVAAGGFAAPGIALMIEEIGWRNTALVSAAIVAIIGLPAAQLVRHRPEPYGMLPDGDPARPPVGSGGDIEQFAEVSMTPRQALRSRAFWAISFAHAAALLVVSAVMVHFVAHVEEQLDYTRTQAASLITLLTVMVIIGQVVGGWAGDRFNTRAIIAVCLLGHGTAMLLLTFASSLWMVVGFLAAPRHRVGRPRPRDSVHARRVLRAALVRHHHGLLVADRDARDDRGPDLRRPRLRQHGLVRDRLHATRTHRRGRLVADAVGRKPTAPSSAPARGRLARCCCRRGACRVAALAPTNAYVRPTAASIRALNSPSRGPRASASTHSRSSSRFFTPSTTVEMPGIDKA